MCGDCVARCLRLSRLIGLEFCLDRPWTAEISSYFEEDSSMAVYPADDTAFRIAWPMACASLMESLIAALDDRPHPCGGPLMLHRWESAWRSGAKSADRSLACPSLIDHEEDLMAVDVRFVSAWNPICLPCSNGFRRVYTAASRGWVDLGFADVGFKRGWTDWVEALDCGTDVPCLAMGGSSRWWSTWMGIDADSVFCALLDGVRSMNGLLGSLVTIAARCHCPRLVRFGRDGCSLILV
ncbi:hypothetical protein ACLOJK_014604 [Asimina triloba]